MRPQTWESPTATPKTRLFRLETADDGGTIGRPDILAQFRFWPVACRHGQGAALNHLSQPRGRALMHDVSPLAPGVRPGDNTLPGGCGRALRSYVQSGAAEVAEQLAGASVPRWSRPDPFALHRMASTAINRLFPHSEARSWEREFESISLQQTVCLLSRSRFRRSENPAFPRGSGQLALTTRSAETRRCFDIAPDASNISSGHIPVPQCR
jgi:hypothetical protein